MEPNWTTAKKLFEERCRAEHTSSEAEEDSCQDSVEADHESVEEAEGSLPLTMSFTPELFDEEEESLEDFNVSRRRFKRCNAFRETVSESEEGVPENPIVVPDNEEPPQLPPAADGVQVVTNAVIPANEGQFRLQAKNFFLTWPQCDTDKEEVLDKIILLPNVDFAIVCREDHKEADGVHLHAVISFKVSNTRRGFDWLDALAGKHGNYKACRNLTKSVQYVIKDGDYVSYNMDPVEFLGQREKHKSTKVPSKMSQTATFIRERNVTNLDVLDDMDAGQVLLHKRKLEEYIAYQQAKRIRLSLLPWVPLDLSKFTTADFNFKIAKWISENVKVPRVFKQKQLFIWSEGPNTGKTHLINELSKYLAVYHLPKTKFVDHYESDRYDLIVCDEFKAHFTIQFLNEFLQGSKMHLDQKLTGHMKTDNPPMIFLSNYSLDTQYHKAAATGSLDTLIARLKIVKIPAGKKIDLFFQLPQL